MALPWAVRCLPGLSVLAILILAELALQILQTAYIGLSYPTGLVTGHNPVRAQLLFLVYSVFLHVLALIFPIRLCRSVWQASTAVREIYGPGGRYAATIKEKTEDIPSPQQGRSDAQGQYRVDYVDVVHAIMIPSYKEEFGVLEETLKVLASHTLAISTYDIFLAMEDRDPNAVSVATKLESSFRYRFKNMQHTIHPSDIPGEVPGKSSKQVRTKYGGSLNWKDILLTVMDSDTHLLSDYFKIVLRRHIHNRHHGSMTEMTMYMPPIIFDRNSHLVPIMVRVADLMWCGAGLSCFQSKPGRLGIAFPTAVYTVTLPLVHLVEGWDTDAGAVGEDMHMMLKCYFATNAWQQHLDALLSLTYRDLDLYVDRDSKTGAHVLKLGVKLSKTKSRQKRNRRKTYTFNLDDNPLFCIIAHIISLAFDEEAFGAPDLISDQLFRLRVKRDNGCQPVPWERKD